MDLKEFENRENDWLANEIKRESLVSSFDLNEASMLRKEHIRHNHHKDIDVEQIKRSLSKGKKKNQSISIILTIVLFVFICYIVLALVGYFVWMFY